MGRKPPFIEDERDELKAVVRDYINGSTVKRLDEGKRALWFRLTRAFFTAYDYENGVGPLPYDGGVLEQPTKTLSVWKVIEGEFGKKRHDEAKKMNSKIKKR